MVMKFARFTKDSEVFSGVIVNDDIKAIKGDMFGEWEYSGQLFSVDEVKLLAPLVPNQIIGIGVNYVGTIDDLPTTLPKVPVFFFKPLTTVIGPEEEIIIPNAIDQVVFESELAIVIGKNAKHVAEENVFDYVFGYTIGNDVTAPQFFSKDGTRTLGKSFDTFTPLGPFIETELDPFKVVVEARVNHIEKQNSATECMIVPIRKMISYLSSVMTLKKGDVILTGTPLGAEFVGPGSIVECKINEIGTLRNPFVSA
jgi:2-keto-4-pentenoate hydratase/2-oxohepta-3-ene-1,7-dioic acid hydratase in catechol pathway